MVGNLFGGECYSEPQEKSFVKCEQTDDTAIIDFPTRSKESKNEDLNTVQAVIKDKDQNIRYKITGNYINGSLFLEDLSNN